jgi:hypothetical protein
LSVLLGLALPLGAGAQSEHDHQHHDVGGLTALQLDQGERWATDAPLQQGMQQIRDAFERRHAGFHDGSMSAQDYAQLAAELGQSIDHIFAHCKLPPAADAELHKLLAAMMGARAKLSAAESEGMHELHRALLAYPKYFEHPGWPAGS